MAQLKSSGPSTQQQRFLLHFDAQQNKIIN